MSKRIRITGSRIGTLRAIAVAVTLAAMPLLSFQPARAQTQSAAPAGQKLTNEQLDSLTAPIALYPDALLAQVLMAATYPHDVEQAAQWSQQNPNIKGDDAVKAVQSQPWDPSVQSLVAFPQALATMASKIDWTTQLGNAFIAQPSDVMDSVQRLRRAAQSAGNLKSTEQQKVVVQQAPSTSTTTIQIEPANPQVVYVPTYNPTVVYGAWPYPAYPPVYVPPPPGYAIASGFATGLAFGAGIAVANSLWGNCDWNHGNVNVNVNRYNNINVNNRLNANSNNVNWNRNDPQFNRNNVNRNNVANRQNTLNNQNLAANRDQFRGRDQERAQAAQTLQQRTGQNMNQPANQRVQNMRQGGAQNSLNNANLNQRAQNVNRDNALRGAGDGNASRQDLQRGQQSRESFQNQQPNRMGANGGGVQHGGNAGGGLGAGGGGVQRGGGGFGGGGGGGGGFHGGGGGGGFHRR
ncbi:hypothetical protein AWB79_01338 [Caballeronia hypogeia]|uniref:DUF3300 domain-containing protein n=1 Tax=Caballeronia hypogeia TaxID=1777140 RepID=A0A157ZTG0_9BURK|nr:DUF3300 domain-containing protein [Caballeronia hypogeia]SAK48812.1 hypothetical protein AWB79_01338 [Caballeronia hypogeia]